jgi:predicted O-methyltransferase YrrM
MGIREHLAARRSGRAAREEMHQGANAAPPAALRQPLADAARGHTTRQERQWLRRIERLQAELATSPAQVDIVDYGAGNASGTRSKEEMDRGTRITREAGEASSVWSASPPCGLLLFRLIRALQPDHCLELGTAFGISAAYQAAALELNGHGRLTTLEGADELAGFAQDNLARLGLADRVTIVVGRFDDILPTITGPIDYAFIDGRHEERATITYFEQLAPQMSPGGLLVFDDLDWSDGMGRAWRAISSQAATSVTVGGLGLATV